MTELQKVSRFKIQDSRSVPLGAGIRATALPLTVEQARALIDDVILTTEMPEKVKDVVRKAVRELKPEILANYLAEIDPQMAIAGVMGGVTGQVPLAIPSGKNSSSPRLTKREIEVTDLILAGKNSEEVAAALFVSKRTIDFHLANVYEKLEVTNRIQLANRVRELGIG